MVRKRVQIRLAKRGRILDGGIEDVAYEWGERGTWIPLRYIHDATPASAMLWCPQCGCQGQLINHTIRDNGMVSPSLVCPFPKCSFHEWVTLVGWPAKQ